MKLIRDKFAKEKMNSADHLLSQAVPQTVFHAEDDVFAEYPGSCLHELFEQQAQRTPSATAVEHENRGLTYDDLNRRSNRLAHHLRKSGVKPEIRVAICLERSREMIVALLAALKAGAAYVPLDPAYPAERLHFMLKDSGATLLLTQDRFKSLFAKHDQNLLVLDLDNDAAWREQP
jgi:non-ribosomal peptide synthetase component F